DAVVSGDGQRAAERGPAGIEEHDGDVAIESGVEQAGWVIDGNGQSKRHVRRNEGRRLGGDRQGEDGRRRQDADLVAPEFGEPEVATRARGDPAWLCNCEWGVGPGDDDSGYGVDRPDRAFLYLSEPEVAVRPRRDAQGPGAQPWH